MPAGRALSDQMPPASRSSSISKAASAALPRPAEQVCAHCAWLLHLFVLCMPALGTAQIEDCACKCWRITTASHDSWAENAVSPAATAEPSVSALTNIVLAQRPASSSAFSLGSAASGQLPVQTASSAAAGQRPPAAATAPSPAASGPLQAPSSAATPARTPTVQVRLVQRATATGLEDSSLSRVLALQCLRSRQQLLQYYHLPDLAPCKLHQQCQPA